MTDKPISPLRQRMIEDMTARHFAEKVQTDYIRYVKNFAAFLGRSPDTASAEDLRLFQLHMAKTHVSPWTINATIVALRLSGPTSGGGLWRQIQGGARRGLWSRLACVRGRRVGTDRSLCYCASCVRGTMAETRTIAAILAADIVGFSRMTGVDEDRTLARSRALRSELIDPTVAAQNGRVFKRTGDGALVEFRSVVEAVRCAITVQNAMIERNVGMPADQRLDIRIGIHLGDVVEESDGDLMGDGVNIAARLEAVARPGAICISEDGFEFHRAPPNLEPE